jgi:hypothetical protein
MSPLTEITEIYAIIRTLDDAAELVGAWPDEPFATHLADELGPGHHVVPMPVIPRGTGQVANVWRCCVTVTDGQIDVDEPQRLLGTSRLIFDAAELPREHVLVDRKAGALEAEVYGRQRHHVRGYASSAERARDLAVTEAHNIAGP